MTATLNHGRTPGLAAFVQPRPDATASQDPEQRLQPRSSMFLACVLRGPNFEQVGRVRNMSAKGALVELSPAPLDGATVELLRGSLLATATVAWSSPQRCGLRFDSAVDVAAWLKAPARPHQQRVDRIVELVNAVAVPGPGEVPLRHGDDGQPLSLPECASDLRGVVSLLQQLEDALAGDPDTVARHADRLPNLDLAVQLLRAITRRLSGTDDELAEGSAALGSLRMACAQALAADF